MRLAAAVFLGVAISVSAARADPSAGERVFTANKCGGECHYTAGPAKENTIADQLAKKGPELWYAGSKYQKEWLEKWLHDPRPIRPLAYNSLTEDNPGDHPKLSPDDSSVVTEFLMSLTSDVVEAGVVKPKKNLKGRLIFTKKMSCSGCHQFPEGKKFSGGLTGPSLVEAGERLNPDWIFAYLMKPKMLKPVKAMPVFVGILSEKDMKNVASYIGNFKESK